MSLTDALFLDPYRVNFFIARRTDGIKGSGSQNDPWRANDEDEFDELLGTTIPGMLAEGAGARIHLGPGEFNTRGYADGVSGGWQARSRWSIVGSGVDVTILKLVPTTTSKHYFAVGHPLATDPGQGTRADSFSISDLTIDCGLYSNSGIACGAIRVMGDPFSLFAF